MAGFKYHMSCSTEVVPSPAWGCLYIFFRNINILLFPKPIKSESKDETRHQWLLKNSPGDPNVAQDKSQVFRKHLNECEWMHQEAPQLPHQELRLGLTGAWRLDFRCSWGEIVSEQRSIARIDGERERTEQGCRGNGEVKERVSMQIEYRGEEPIFCQWSFGNL